MMRDTFQMHAGRQASRQELIDGPMRREALICHILATTREGKFEAVEMRYGVATTFS